jgi:hypothetical protein
MIAPTRKSVRSLSVRELRNQEAQHDSGAIVRSAGRENIELEHQGRILTIGVDRGLGSDLYYLPASLSWDDGTPIPLETKAWIKEVITEVSVFWGSSAEFSDSE